MTTRPFSSADALKFGWTVWRIHAAPLLILGASMALLAAMSQALGRGAGGAVLSVPLQLLQLALALVLVRLSLRIHDGEPVAPYAAEHLKGYWRFVLAALLYGLGVSLGLVLLIVPGVWFGLTFVFAPFFVAAGEGDLAAAFRESQRVTRGVRGQLFVFGLALMALNFAGVLALGLGVVITVPVSSLAAVYVFRRLQGRPEPTTHPPPVLTPRAA